MSFCYFKCACLDIKKITEREHFFIFIFVFDYIEVCMLDHRSHWVSDETTASDLGSINTKRDMEMT